MTPGTVTAIAMLLAEALSASVSFAEIMRDVKGQVSPEVWTQIVDDMDASEAYWRQAGDGG